MPVTFDGVGGKVSGALFPRGYGLSYAHAAHVAQLSETPHVAPDRRARDTLYHAAHVTAPWSIYLADASAEVRLTTTRQDSPQRGLWVAQSAAGVQASWDGSKPSVFRIAGRQADWRARAAAGVAVEVRYRVDERPSDVVRFGVTCMAPYQRHPTLAPGDAAQAQQMTLSAAHCGTDRGALLDLTSTLQASPLGQWRSLMYSLACFSTDGADLSNVEAPFAVATAGRLKITIAEVRLVPVKGSPHCGGG